MNADEVFAVVVLGALQLALLAWLLWTVVTALRGWR